MGHRQQGVDKRRRWNHISGAGAKITMKPRLLVIEDDAALQTLLFDILSHEGYDVSVAMADDYLYMAHETQPDILVLGCDGDRSFARGWQIAATVTRQLPQVTLVMLSTNSATVAEVGQTTRGMLFSAGLRKPFVIDDLLQTVAACLQQSVGRHS